MKQAVKNIPCPSGNFYSQTAIDTNRLCARWKELCEKYLPVKPEDSIWRHNRQSSPHAPPQGWKLHISATIFEACDVFEKTAPFLISNKVHFKAPDSLDELALLNSGLRYGYHQIGKFITVYPETQEKALEYARKLDKLTKDFFSVSVPFDERYAPESSVFYRYGAFSNIKVTDENGKTFPVIKNRKGEYVRDDRLKAVPEWIPDPFPNAGKKSNKTFADTPLGTNYRIFQAVTQRGKGGTYKAIDLSQNQPRLCIVKEGRKNGELGWNGQDGFLLVKNEFEVLSLLKNKYKNVPRVYDSFTLHENFYFVMEYIDGKSLSEIMQPRRRRLSFGKIIKFAYEIAEIIEQIHLAGWVWNDCKPSNLILTPEKTLRPIDFEGAFPIDQTEKFDWHSKGFSDFDGRSGKSADFFALGAVLYFLLTGRFFTEESREKLARIRRDVPKQLENLVETLLFEDQLEISEIKREFKKLQKTKS